MITQRDVLNCLPLLASVLGDKYGVKVEIGGFSAWTNGNVIHIPRLPLECDYETLALAKGYTDHEAAHIRHTDFAPLNAACLDPVTFKLFNALEDYRVENCLCAIYPGCRQNIDWLIHRFFAGEAAKTDAQTPALAVINYVLLTVRSWSVPEVETNRLKAEGLIRQQFAGLAEKLDAILQKAHACCPNTQTCIAYAKELADCIRQWEPPKESASTSEQSSEKAPKAREKQPNAGQSQGKGNDKSTQNDANATNNPALDDKISDCSQCTSDKDSPLDNADFEQNDGSATETEETSNTADKSPTESEERSDTVPADEISQAGQPDQSVSQAHSQEQADEAGLEEGESRNPATPKEELEELFKLESQDLPDDLGDMLAETLTGCAAQDYDKCVEVATCGEKWTYPLSGDELVTALRGSNALRQRIQGLLQAQTLRHCDPGRHGRLHTASIYRLKTGNPRVFTREIRKQGLNTAIHILLDCSGSMENGPIELARQACFAIAKALENIKGVNPAVTAFPSQTALEGVTPMLRHGERLKNNFGVKAFGNTPLAPALWWVLQQLCTLKEERRIILILTDGWPDAIEPCLYAIQQAARLGMEVYGIGIQTAAIENLLPQQHCKTIDNIRELAPAMFGLLQETLLHKPQGGRL